jgi:hypothetical protein
VRIGKYVLIPENISAAETEFTLDREQTEVTIYYLMNDETTLLTQLTPKKAEAEKWMKLVDDCITSCADKRDRPDKEEEDEIR